MGIIYLFSATLFFICQWSKEVFNVSLEEIIFTFNAPIKGAETSVTTGGLKECIPPILGVMITYIVLIILDVKLRKNNKLTLNIGKANIKFDLLKFSRRITSVLSLAFFIFSILYAEFQYKIVTYVSNVFTETSIYNEYYVHPDKVKIQADGDEKNLILIYLESMETTYASAEDGGV